MENMSTIEVGAEGENELLKAIDNLITQMKAMRTQMAEDQSEIERLRSETDIILAQLKASRNVESAARNSRIAL